MPVLATMFFLIFAMNLPSVIPGLNISPNARVGMPLVLAIVGYFVFIYAGAKRYGFFKYVKSSIVIPNLPPALHVLVVPLEFLSTFILRPATLTLRLMANMLAGHIHFGSDVLCHQLLLLPDEWLDNSYLLEPSLLRLRSHSLSYW